MQVAVIGLGKMGMPMARRLMAAGNELTVWNRTPERARAMEGAVAAATPRPSPLMLNSVGATD